MDVREAVQIAKDYIKKVYEGEEIRNLGLEEVEIDDETDDWLITLGFSRKWDYPRSNGLSDAPETKRAYKTVRIKADSGEVVSVKDRILEAR